MTTEFNFSDRQAQREIRRNLRRLELEQAFRSGRIVRQGTTFWSIAGCIYTRFKIHADATFIEPFQSDPAYLADHLENREHGFGFETVILHA